MAMRCTAGTGEPHPPRPSTMSHSESPHPDDPCERQEGQLTASSAAGAAGRGAGPGGAGGGHQAFHPGEPQPPAPNGPAFRRLPGPAEVLGGKGRADTRPDLTLPGPSLFFLTPASASFPVSCPFPPSRTQQTVTEQPLCARQRSGPQAGGSVAGRARPLFSRGYAQWVDGQSEQPASKNIQFHLGRRQRTGHQAGAPQSPAGRGPHVCRLGVRPGAVPAVPSSGRLGHSAAK